MNFVKIGNKWFNPNLVTDISRRANGSYSVYLAAPRSRGRKNPATQSRTMHFDGEEAEIFEKWLAENQVDPAEDTWVGAR